MRAVNVALDLYSGFICLVMAAWLMTGGRFRVKSNRYFLGICLGNLGMLLGDLTNWVCEGYGNPWNPFLLHVGSWAFYFCALPILLFYTLYVIEFLQEKAHVPRKYKWIAWGVCGIYLVGVLITPFTGFFYTIGPGNLYVRGLGFLAAQVLSQIIYALDLYLVWRYRRYLTLREGISFSAYVIFPIAAEIIQIFHYGIALMNTAVTISLVLVYLNIQWGRELLIKQQEAELSESRIQILMSQIQPHFLYNALTVIRQLCESDPPAAKQAVTDFAGFLRANMESLTSPGLIPFEKELRHAEHYLNLERRRFLGRLEVVYEIETTDFRLPALTLQPIVENAVRHGLLKKEEGGTVIIETRAEADVVRVTVSDDGVGFEVEKMFEKELEERDHVGIRNVKDRLLSLKVGTLEVESQPGCGTRVVMTIWKENRE